ncbi:glycosyltransferase [Agromyces sp. NPDC056389]
MNARSARVSVCMATYNGAAYLAEQIDSVLEQLGPADELVITDDRSTDETVAIIQSYADPRIVLHRSGRNQGYVRAFEDAIGRSSGDVVLLADQDDVWLPGRVDVMVAALDRSAVVASNLSLLGSGAPLKSPISGRPWRLRSSTADHRRRNLARIIAGDAPYFGCAMGVRRDALALAVPFPAFLTESHDLWIAIVGNVSRSMGHVDADTLLRRVHEANASSPRPRGLAAAVRSRWMLLRAIRVARTRVRAGHPL